MFADEARFGRMNRIRPCWAPIGTRPGVAAQLIREYIYLYGAVSPKDGTCLYLIMPTSNTACFQVFLDVLARKFARRDILLVLDGAPNHRCAALESRHSLAPLMHGLTLKSEGFTTWPIGFIFDPLSQNSSMFPRARARA